MESKADGVVDTSSPETNFQVHEHSEIYEEVDGRFQYVFSRVVFERAGQLYTARSGVRCLDRAKLEPRNLTDIVLVPIEAYAPLCEPKHTTLSLLPSNCFIKRPQVGSYDSAAPTRIAEDVLAEIEICEKLRLHSHPNIEQYLGCQVRDGRIVGLCFEKYDQTLMDRANPGHHGKRAFKGCGWDAEECTHFFEGVEAGLKHLHSMHLAHNDINPANIMFSKDNSAVIIDFGSCRPFGEYLGQGGRTYEWYDDTVQTSRPENDTDAVAEIREWMSDKAVKKFQFME